MILILWICQKDVSKIHKKWIYLDFASTIYIINRIEVKTQFYKLVIKQRLTLKNKVFISEYPK